MRYHWTAEATNTAYLRGVAQGRRAFERDEALFSSRLRVAATKAVAAASSLTLAEKLALHDGFTVGATIRSVELGWRNCDAAPHGWEFVDGGAV